MRVIELSKDRRLSAEQIADRLNIARSSVFTYRRLYRRGGFDRLASIDGPGRPRRFSSPRFHAVIANSLRHLAAFHVPTVQRWLRRHCHRHYPGYIVRRQMKYYERLFGYRLPRKRMRNYVVGPDNPPHVKLPDRVWPEVLGSYGLWEINPTARKTRFLNVERFRADNHRCYSP